MTAFHRPNDFMYEMIGGVFKRFKHSHAFSTEHSGVWMTDTSDYEAPLGVVGKLADALFLKRYMTHFLTQRNLIIQSVEESGDWKRLLID